MKYGLTQAQIETLVEIFAPYAEKISHVDIFGSRAQGNYRPNSDLDLVIYGTVSEQDVDRLWTLLAESNLPISVDVKAYHHVRYAPLRRHTDRACNLLFTHDELLAKSKPAVAGCV